VCSPLKSVSLAIAGMKAIAPEISPQENMMRAIQRRAPTRSSTRLDGTSNRK